MKHTIASLVGLSIFAGFAIMGCSGDNNNQTSTGSNPPAAIDIKNLSTVMAEIYCGNAFSCCTSTEITQLFKFVGNPPKTEAECNTTFKELFDAQLLAQYQASIDAGRLKYDGAKAGACLELAKNDCASIGNNFGSDSNDCNTTFVGLVADGGECATTTDCSVPDSLCSGATNMMLGKCAVRPAAGAECLEQYACAEGLVCSYQNAKFMCIKPLANGEACTSSGDCTSGLCGSSNTCEDPKALGSACTFSQECKDGYCEMQAMKCTALKAEGAACADFTECQSQTCDMMAKVCAPDPFATPACDGM